jgi:nitrogen regulatory protein P-II 2
MNLHPLKQLVIVTESILTEQILPKLIELGATGYTYFIVDGYGSRGARGDVEGDNVRIDVICKPETAEAILTFVSHHYFENYGCIAWVTDVSVVRGAHYVK